MATFIHPSADVQSLQIGEGTKVWQYCVVLPGAIIGERCNINALCLIEDEVVVGNNVTVKSGVYLWNGVTIDDDAFIGPNATFTNDPAPRSKQPPEKWAVTHVHKGASIGANATLLPGVSIGEYAIIGAGSVVTKDVPQHELWYGNPARVQGYVCVCGGRLSDGLVCNQCGQTYAQSGQGIVASNG
jgi:UDP-2-acetamido-3-amino-2,3-dideoxy-glucuronate N-acetyltransferase